MEKNCRTGWSLDSKIALSLLLVVRVKISLGYGYIVGYTDGVAPTNFLLPVLGQGPKTSISTDLREGYSLACMQLAVVVVASEMKIWGFIGDSKGCMQVTQNLSFISTPILNILMLSKDDNLVEERISA
jgi:hypothetical protein